MRQKKSNVLKTAVFRYPMSKLTGSEKKSAEIWNAVCPRQKFLAGAF